MSACPEENALVEFVQGDLPHAAAAEAEAHLDACERCSALVAEFARVFDDIGPSIAPPPAGATLTGSDDDLGNDVPKLLRGATVGRYVVVDLIGAGAMGFVYGAYDPELDRRVALKLLRERALEPSQRVRLLREAQAAGRLSHPNVIVVHDVGQFDGSVFITMEFVEGGTLAQWLGQRDRSRREILAAFTAAGRGLAAAHHAGIVHRDFKPANVLVGSGPDARVRVTDFGLARPRTEALRSEPEVTAPHAAVGSVSSSRPALLQSLTQTGAIVGTPAYMSPEQFEGRPADERSDQFSFCVALYEALAGTRPFAGRSLAELSTSVCAGRLHDPNALAALPRKLRRALERGLCAEPSARFPSMDALLTALSPNKGRRFGPLLGAAGIAAGAAAILTTADSDAPCSAGAAQIEETWTPARREEIASAFAATALPYQARAAATTTASLDRFVEVWGETYVDACTAHREGEQSAPLLDKRMACLGAAREDLEVVLAVLANADATAVENASALGKALPVLEACSDLERLRESVRPPPPELTEQVAALRTKLRHAHARTVLGHAREGVEEAREAYAAAQDLEYAPLRSRAAWILAEIEQRTAPGKSHDDLYVDALGWALAARDDRAAAAVTMFMLQNYADPERARDPSAKHWARLADGLLARLPYDPKLTAELLHTKAQLARYRGDLEESRRLAEQDLAYTREHIEQRGARIGVALNTLAQAEFALGDYEGARARYVEVLAQDRERVGEGHPDVATSRQNLAATLIALGRFDEALPHLRGALAVREALYGERAPQLLSALQNLGSALLNTGEGDAAVAALERALAIASKAFGDEHSRTEEVRTRLGGAYFELGQLEEARQAYARSLAALSRRLSDEDMSVAMARYNFAEVQLELGHVEDAQRDAKRAHDALAATLKAEHPYLGYTLTLLGRIALARGDAVTARSRLEQALVVRAAAQTTDLERAGSQVYLALALADSDPARSADLFAAASPIVRDDQSPSAAKLRKLLPSP